MLIATNLHLLNHAFRVNGRYSIAGDGMLSGKLMSRRNATAHVSKTPHTKLYQFTLPGLSGVDDALTLLEHAGVEERGAIFTRREVVDFILDLVGYTTDQPLAHHAILEPSFGDGDFLLPIVDRLVASYRSKAAREKSLLALKPAIRAFELHRPTFESTKAKLNRHLIGIGCAPKEAQALCDAWLAHGDFLLSEDATRYSHIVGNPPYVRQEMIADVLMAEYRRRFKTIYDRADIYVPFIEHSLSLLAENGHLGFICPDRWMKNKYGRPLRQLVADNYHLRAYVDMVDTPAFLSEVTAYPAIVVIERALPAITRLAHRPSIDLKVLSELATHINAPTCKSNAVQSAHVATGSDPWILESLDRLQIVRRLEQKFPNS